MPTREQIVRLDRRCVWHPYTPMGPYVDSGDPLVIDRAEGIYLYDRDGRRLIDGIGSWWASLLGHGHPRLVEALRRQAERLCHCALAGITHEPAAALAAELLKRCGPQYARVFYSDDGSTAVEVAIRIAFQFWQARGRAERVRFASLEEAFHGETVGAASVSGNDVFHRALEPLMFDCIRLPSPGTGAGTDGRWEEALEGAERLLREHAASVAAVIVEPLVQGAAGMLMHPPEYLRRLHTLTRELDVLLIADEVFVGCGRTGSFLASHQAEIAPDIVCLAKGLTGGVLPMAATAVTERVFEEFRGGPDRTLWYGHTFTGNPLGAAVALEVLRVLEDDRVIGRLAPTCDAMQRGLESLADHRWVRDPRRTGMIAAFTLAPPGEEGSSDYLSEAGWRFHAEALRRGAWLRPLGNVVYTVPALTITVEQVDELFAIIRDSLRAAFG